MSDATFIDANVLLYAYDPRYPRKSVRADEIVATRAMEGRCVISTQVLQEFYAAATRKLRLTPEFARSRVEFFIGELEVVTVQPHLILGAIDIQRLHRISFWDALLVRCASAANCSTLLTEDLNNGQTIEGVTIVNPFVEATRAGEARARYTPTVSGPSKRVKLPKLPAAHKTEPAVHGKRRSAARAAP